MNTVQKSILPIALAVVVGLAGCSQVSEQVADWLKPPSASEMSVRIRDQAARGEVHEALRKGESFVAKRPSESGEVHRVLSEIYLQLGDTIKAMQHMHSAVATGSGTAITVPSALTTSPLPAKPDSPAALQTNTDGASARVTPGGGLEVKAGGASAKVPD